MKKRWIIGFIVVILLISLLPFPQKVERTYYGVNIENGEKVDIALDMKYLRYLFKRDKMRGKITVTCEDKTTLYTEHVLQYFGYLPVDNEDETFHYFWGFYWNTDIIKYDEQGEIVIGEFEDVKAYLSKDYNKILLCHEPSENAEDPELKQYIGNAENNKQQETTQYFGKYIQ